ncbi:MAG: 6-hydroxymethylpterin diphosphokinase MptE-like protein [Methermicoccaceae archaeon]
MSNTREPNADMGWWMPLYQSILDEFGFDRGADERCARIVARLVCDAGNGIPLQRLSELIEGRVAVICGKAKSLAPHIERARGLGMLDGCVLIAADGATSVLLSSGIVPHIIVSDLDGNMDDIIAASEQGSVVVVHAHGDNIPLVRRYVPVLRGVVATTQSVPFDGVYNFGGFTDGDRCVFLARAFGASRAILLGFDFCDATKGATKRKKLVWARRLIYSIDDMKLEILK